MTNELDLAEGAPDLDGPSAGDPCETAAEHDAWFRAEVQRGIREADDPDAVWLPNEEVERRSELRRAEWLCRAETQKAVA